MPRSQHGPTYVVGYDGSEASRAAIALAARRAGSEGQLVIVHAYDLPPDFLGAPNFDELLTKRQAHGQALLDELPLATGDALLDVDYETELIGGPPAQAITHVAIARDAEEIIVGARGLGPVRALLGSVSHELLHIAERPVVVIPSAALRRNAKRRNGREKRPVPAGTG